MIKYLFLLLSTFLITSCEHKEKNKTLDDLNSIKKKFLISIFKSEVEESPFDMNYSLKTVFFSPDLISLFGEIHVYDHLPHEWRRYEGKTLCKVKGKLKEISLLDLFPTMDHKEFLRNYCEKTLKKDPLSYFTGKDPLRTKLTYEDIRTFVIDDKFLIIVFQPYTVGGLGDGPFHVKIPFEHLKGHWNDLHPFPQLINKALSSKAFTGSWDSD